MSTPGLSTRAALKSAKKATLTKVLREVLDLDENDLLMKAVESQGVRGIDDLLALSATDVDTMVHNKDDGTREAVPKVQKNLLKILQDWNVYLMSVQGTKRVDWDDNKYVNIAEFDEFLHMIQITQSEL